MNSRHTQYGKYVVDGVAYMGVAGVFREAVQRGFNGCRDTIYKRLRDGHTTFAEIAKPVNSGQSEGGRKSQEAKRQEMEQVIAALDARKRLMEAA